jgi:hypothetical protein
MRMGLAVTFAGLALAGAAAMLETPPAISTGDSAPGRAATEQPQDYSDMNPGYDGRLQFVRIQFTPAGRGSGFGRGRGGREPVWAHDYPRAERNFLRILDEATYIGPRVDASNILSTDDPDLFKYPVAYMVEVGAWSPTEEEAEGLGQYLTKGGFLIIDDFRGGWDLANLEAQMGRVLPGAAIVEIEAEHEIFDSFFRIDPQQVIPPYGAQFPLYLGIYEDNDRDKRLLAIINYNNDIAEYWEFSDRGYYPIDLSNEAYKLGVNYIVYAMTH